VTGTETAEVLHELGCAAFRRDEVEAAVGHFLGCIRLAPDNATPHYNLGAAYRRLGRLEASVIAFERALELRPDFPQATFNLSLSLLGLGRWDEGWPLFESRFESRSITLPSLPFPRWTGQPLAGRSILVLRDDGLGDELQMFRFARVLGDMGARVHWVCSPPLLSLFEANRGGAVIRSKADPAGLPACDYWVRAFSLPLLLGVRPDRMFGAQGYLHAPTPSPGAGPEFAPTGELRVGLVWCGNSQHVNDRRRSLHDLEVLRPLWDVAGVGLVSLQIGQAARPADLPLIDLAPHLDDFAATARAIAGLDLVITVDTSTAHLAGAMGKACWILLPGIECDWRWLQERTDSPWYTSVRLFRQGADGDWGPVVARLAQALATEASRAASGR
jgi:hypothetical protein